MAFVNLSGPPGVFSSRFSVVAVEPRFTTEFLGKHSTHLKICRGGRTEAFSGAEYVVCNAVLATLPFSSPSAEELQETYGCQGVRFVEVAGMTATELRLRNGSSTRMLLPRAQITSYRPHMWHGGEEELLHTVRPASRVVGTEAVSGGIELKFAHTRDPLSSILPSYSQCWRVESVTVEPSNYAQMTLTNFSTPDLGIGERSTGSLKFRYVVTLSEDSLSTALVISNIGSMPVDFTGSMVNHLAVSSEKAVFAVGLKGYNYRSLLKTKAKPSITNFFPQIWGSKKPAESESAKVILQAPSVANGDSDTRDAIHDLEGGQWTVEAEAYSQLHGDMDRLYPTPPDYFSVMDRGFRRSVVLKRFGFEEFFLSNPGQDSKLTDCRTFMCVGPAQQSNPVRLEENQEWQAAQTLLNPSSADET